MASGSLPPLVQRIVVENPNAIPDAMQTSADSMLRLQAQSASLSRELLTTKQAAAALSAEMASQKVISLDEYAAAKTLEEQETALTASLAGVNAELKVARQEAAVAAAQTKALAAAEAEATAEAMGWATANYEAGQSLVAVEYNATRARVATMGAFKDVGLAGSRVLTSFISQSEILGPIMAAAFPVVAVVAFIEILAHVPEVIKKATDAMMGWNEEAKKDFAEMTADSRKAYEQMRKMADEEERLSLVGLKGTAKTTEEIKVQADVRARLAEEHRKNGEEILHLEQQIEANRIGADTLRGVDVRNVDAQKDRVAYLRKLYEQQAEELNHMVVSSKKADAEDLEAKRELSVKLADDQKKVIDERLRFVAEANSRELAEGKISGAQYLAMFKEVEAAKLQVTIENLKLRQRLSGGGTTTGELNAQIAAAQLATQDTIAAKEGELALKEKATALEVALAKIHAARTVEEAVIKAKEDSVKKQIELGTIDLSAAKSQLVAQENANFESQKKELDAELALVRAAGPAKEAEAISINAKLQALATEHEKRIDDINAEIAHKQQEQDKKRIEDARRMAETITRDAEKAATEQLRIDQQAAQSRLADHQITLAQWQQQEIAAIEKWENAELTAVRQVLAALEAAGLKETADYKKYKDQQILIAQQAAQKEDAINQQVAKHNAQLQQKIMDDFANDATKIIMGQQTMGKTLMGIYENMTGNMIRSLIKLSEQWILGELTHKAMAQQGILVDAKKAASGAYSAVTDIPIIGPVLAPAAAAAAFAAVMAFGSFEKGGMVPRDMVAQVHEGEGVFSKPVMQMIERGNVNTTTTGATSIRNSMTVNNHGRAGDMTPDMMWKSMERMARRKNRTLGYGS